MGLFGRNKPADPTADWPAAPAKPPAVDLESGAVGPLAIGDPLEKARALGRPESTRHDEGGKSRLQYAGYSLEFDAGKFVCFHLEPEGSLSVAVGGLTLSRASQVKDVRAWFGEATSDTSSNGLTWMDYERGGATIALEFDAEGLTCVQVYAEGWA